MKIVEVDNCNYEDGEVQVQDVTVEYTQTGDCTENRDDMQSIVISTRNNGMARFINIKTENWSIDNADVLVKLIEDFSRRAGLKTEK